MALFRNLCVNLPDCLCDVRILYVSAQSLAFLGPGKKLLVYGLKIQYMFSSPRTFLINPKK